MSEAAEAQLPQPRVFKRSPHIADAAGALRMLMSLRTVPEGRPDLKGKEPDDDDIDSLLGLIFRELPVIKARPEVQRLILERGLTDDDISMLLAYKLEMPYPIYRWLNGFLTCTRRDPDVVEYVGPAFTLLYRAMEKLPLVTANAQRAAIVRNIPALRDTFNNYQTRLAPGQHLSFWGFSSFTTDAEVMSRPSFCGAPNEPAIVYVCGELSGVDMEPFKPSGLPSEAELLPLCPGVFRVTAVTKLFGSKVTVTLQQEPNHEVAYVKPDAFKKRPPAASSPTAVAAQVAVPASPTSFPTPSVPSQPYTTGGPTSCNGRTIADLFDELMGNSDLHLMPPDIMKRVFDALFPPMTDADVELIGNAAKQSQIVDDTVLHALMIILKFVGVELVDVDTGETVIRDLDQRFIDTLSNRLQFARVYFDVALRVTRAAGRTIWLKGVLWCLSRDQSAFKHVQHWAGEVGVRTLASPVSHASPTGFPPASQQPATKQSAHGPASSIVAATSKSPTAAPKMSGPIFPYSDDDDEGVAEPMLTAAPKKSGPIFPYSDDDVVAAAPKVLPAKKALDIDNILEPRASGRQQLHPAAPSGSRMTLAIDPRGGRTSAVAGEPFVLLLTLTGAYGSAVSDIAQDAVAVCVNGGVRPNCTITRDMSCVDGRYQVTTSPTQAGSMVVEVQLAGTPGSAVKSQTINVDAAAMDWPSCGLMTAESRVKAGHDTDVLIMAKDRFGNPVQALASNFEAALEYVNDNDQPLPEDEQPAAGHTAAFTGQQRARLTAKVVPPQPGRVRVKVTFIGDSNPINFPRLTSVMMCE